MTECQWVFAKEDGGQEVTGWRDDKEAQGNSMGDANLTILIGVVFYWAFTYVKMY